VSEFEQACAVWLGMLFGLSGIGGILTVTVRFLRNSVGGLQ